MAEYGLVTAFLAGLLGGVHCVGMCGGLVAAMSLQGSGARQPFTLHLGYNLGRMASYTVAGGLAGLVGSAAYLSETLLPIQTGLYAVAQGVLILMGLYIAGLNRAVLWLERAGGGLWRRLQPLFGRLLPIQGFAGALAAGAVWGWLPCGLVYSVLVYALASGSALDGAMLLLAFGLGTLPNLLAMGWAAAQMRDLARNRALRLAAGLTLAAFGVWGLHALLRGYLT